MKLIYLHFTVLIPLFRSFIFTERLSDEELLSLNLKVLIPLFRSFIFTGIRVTEVTGGKIWVLIPLFRSFIFTLRSGVSVVPSAQVLIPLFRSFIFTQTRQMLKLSRAFATF